jgi:hypothetical protein
MNERMIALDEFVTTGEKAVVNHLKAIAWGDLEKSRKTKGQSAFPIEIKIGTSGVNPALPLEPTCMVSNFKYRIGL